MVWAGFHIVPVAGWDPLVCWYGGYGLVCYFLLDMSCGLGEGEDILCRSLAVVDIFTTYIHAVIGLILRHSLGGIQHVAVNIVDGK